MPAASTTAREELQKPAVAIFSVLLAVSFCHLLNDLVQSLIPALYPILKERFRLDFGQLGFISFTFQLTASLLQPVIGMATDRRPMPYSLPIGMTFTLFGLLLLTIASTYPALLLAAGFVGLGSAVFHPECSRVARMASGGQLGMAQSLFQVGGNAGSAIGPLLAAYIVVPRGQSSIAWFSLVALLGIVILTRVGHWYKARTLARSAVRTAASVPAASLPRGRIAGALVILVTLIFSKYFYMASLGSYYTFYLIHKFGVSVQSAQIHLFVFLGAVAAGTIIGGPVGDRIGRKAVIWASILAFSPLPSRSLTQTYSGRPSWWFRSA